MRRKGERVMEKLQGFTDHVMLYVKTLVKWLLAAALIGTVGGAVGSLFRLGVEYATGLRTEVPALLYALPLAGVLIVALYRFLRTQGVGTNAVLDAVHQGRELPILLIPAIFLATLLTHLAGGSAGREGAALQIGGDLGEHFGKMLRMDDKDCRLATLCGMSALFSALFGTPLAAVFFALEVVSIGVLYYSGLIPCITSSLVAYAVSLRFGIEPMRFAVAAPETTISSIRYLSGRVSVIWCTPEKPRSGRGWRRAAAPRRRSPKRKRSTGKRVSRTNTRTWRSPLTTCFSASVTSMSSPWAVASPAPVFTTKKNWRVSCLR